MYEIGRVVIRIICALYSSGGYAPDASGCSEAVYQGTQPARKG